MAGDYDIYDLPKRIRNAEKRLENAQSNGDVTDEDAEAIREYVRHRRVNDDLSGHTVEGMYGKLRVAATEAEIPLTVVSDLKDVTTVLHAVKYRRGEDNPLSEKSIHSYKSYLRGFFDYFERDFAEKIDMSRSNGTNRSIDPNKMLTQDDLRKMRKAAANPRDTALMAVMMDTGARISMLATLRIKDLDLEAEPPVYTPNPNAESLKGAPQHAYPLIESIADLRTYLNHHHPRPDDPDAPVFHKMPGYYRPEEGDDGTIAHGTIWKNLKGIAARGGVEKPVNAHNWRHSAVTRMKRERYTSEEIQHRAGWNDPNMLDRYGSVEAEEMNTQIGVQAGIIEEDEGESRTRSQCGTCREVLSPSHDYCPRCGNPATPDAHRQRDKARAAVRDDLADSDISPEQREVARVIADALDNPADVLREVEALASKDGDE